MNATLSSCVVFAACRNLDERHRFRPATVNQSAPSTPQIDIKKAPSFTQEQPHLDAYERALRQRKQEADERKARLLAGYDAIARSGVCGPKIVVREELEQMEIPDDAKPPKPKFSCTSSFSGGYSRTWRIGATSDMQIEPHFEEALETMMMMASI
jgi:hypothetical protein